MSNKKKGNDVVSRESTRVVRRVFPGPSRASAPLRVSFSRRAYGDLSAHAKESLDAEVCGVMAGEVCEDDEGPFVQVQAIVRGAAAREARAHVTFTHETWNQIHATMDREHGDLQIVGWYHTHPGFGVEFSAMDRFIHENFFSGRTQIAFLTDPLGGDTALAFNSGGFEYIARFWVDGREHAAKAPHASAAPNPSSAGVRAGYDGDVRRDLERLEARVSQLVQALDEQRSDFYKLLTASVVLFCSAIVLTVAYHIWADRYDRIKPPQPAATFSVPVKIGNDTVILSLDAVRWDVPPRMNSYLDKVAKAEAEERAKLIRELMEQQLKQSGGRIPSP